MSCGGRELWHRRRLPVPQSNRVWVCGCRPPLVLLDLRTSDGVVGRAYRFAYKPSGARAIAHVLDDALALVRGEPLAPAEIARTLERRPPVPSSARSGSTSPAAWLLSRMPGCSKRRTGGRLPSGRFSSF
jgi:hypothetical protein